MYRHILVNVVGRIWVGLLNLALAPLYAQWMSIEAYGLVGFFLSLQAVFMILEVGLSTAINREIARGCVTPEAAQDTLDLTRSLEVVYWLSAIVITLVVAAIADPLARYWLQPRQLPVEVVRTAIVFMGAAIASQWICGYYLGGLMGLQQHAISNTTSACIATLRNAGNVVLLSLYSNSVAVFFFWQALVTLLGAACAGILLWRCLPSGTAAARFRWAHLRRVSRFVIGVNLVSFLLLLANQLDKIILSKTVSLNDFGYYSLAWTLAGAIYMLQGPICAVASPALSQLVAMNDRREIGRVYHHSCQLLSALLLPVVAVTGFFAGEILLLWSRDAATVDRTRAIVMVLMPAAAISGLLQMPLTLQRAYGWTRMAAVTNALSLLVLGPLTYISATQFGLLETAAVFVCGRVVTGLLQIELTHLRLLPHGRRQWYLRDVGLPAVVSVATAGIARTIYPQPSNAIAALAFLAATFAGCWLATACATPATMEILHRVVRSLHEISFSKRETASQMIKKLTPVGPPPHELPSET